MQTEISPCVAHVRFRKTFAELPSVRRTSSVVLLDLFAKELPPESIYGDLTWMGYVGATVPEEFAAVFAIVASARDAAV